MLLIIPSYSKINVRCNVFRELKKRQKERKRKKKQRTSAFIGHTRVYKAKRRRRVFESCYDRAESFLPKISFFRVAHVQPRITLYCVIGRAAAATLTPREDAPGQTYTYTHIYTYAGTSILAL